MMARRLIEVRFLPRDRVQRNPSILWLDFRELLKVTSADAANISISGIIYPCIFSVRLFDSFHTAHTLCYEAKHRDGRNEGD